LCGGGAAAVVLTLLSAGSAVAASGGETSGVAALKRPIVGTVITAPALEIAHEPGAWAPARRGAPVLQDSRLRSGAGKPAVVALGANGVVALGENSQVRVGVTDKGKQAVILEGDGELRVRIPTASGLYFLTDSTIVAGPATAAATEAGEQEFVQALITQKHGETTVRVLNGDVRVANRDKGAFVAVAAGERVVVTGASSPPAPVEMAAAEKERTRRRFGWFGTKTGMIVTGGVVAAAVGGGIAAAAGGGGGGDGGDDDGGRPSSPFKP
jgi:hypothetical protein